MTAAEVKLPASHVPADPAGHRWTSDDLTAWLLVAPAVLAILVMFVVPVGYVLLFTGLSVWWFRRKDILS